MKILGTGQKLHTRVKSNIAYKCTPLKWGIQFADEGSLRMRTLYENRNEEQYSVHIGDRTESVRTTSMFFEHVSHNQALSKNEQDFLREAGITIESCSHTNIRGVSVHSENIYI